MDEASYLQYDAESMNWLHRGRLSLVEHLLDEAAAIHPIRRLLEVGAGVGQNLSLLARYGRVDAAEINALGRDRIDALGVAEHVYTDPIPFALREPYDVICALDVVEHLVDDRHALTWMAAGLAPGGVLIVSVPAYQWLFGPHDEALGHYRRYSRRQLVEVVPEHLTLVRAGYFNSTVFPAVALSRMLTRARSSGSNRSGPKQSSVVRAPADRWLGRTLGVEASIFARRPIVPFGLSVFAMARANG